MVSKFGSRSLCHDFVSCSGQCIVKGNVLKFQLFLSTQLKRNTSQVLGKSPLPRSSISPLSLQQSRTPCAIRRESSTVEQVVTSTCGYTDLMKAEHTLLNHKHQRTTAGLHILALSHGQHPVLANPWKTFLSDVSSIPLAPYIASYAEILDQEKNLDMFEHSTSWLISAMVFHYFFPTFSINARYAICMCDFSQSFI